MTAKQSHSSALPNDSLPRAFGPPPAIPGEGASAACRVFLAMLEHAGYRLRVVRAFRVSPVGPRAVPLLPELETETALFPPEEPLLRITLQDPAGELHEIVFRPESATLTIDRRARACVRDDVAHAQLCARLVELFPECEIDVRRPIWLRADFRVARTVSELADAKGVLDGEVRAQRRRVDRLAVVAALTEKSSRVSSWTVRTAYPPALAAMAVLLYLVLGTLPISAGWRDGLRYATLALLGGAMLLLGMIAVRLTETGMQLARRAEEYRMILDAREHGAPVVQLAESTEIERFSVCERARSAFSAASAVKLKAAWLAIGLERAVELRALARIPERAGADTLQDAWREIRDRGRR